MHSIGVAKKAAALAEHLGYDRLDIQKIYLAGALHDIAEELAHMRMNGEHVLHNENYVVFLRL